PRRTQPEPFAQRVTLATEQTAAPQLGHGERGERLELIRLERRQHVEAVRRVLVAPALEVVRDRRRITHDERGRNGVRRDEVPPCHRSLSPDTATRPLLDEREGPRSGLA